MRWDLNDKERIELLSAVLGCGKDPIGYGSSARHYRHKYIYPEQPDMAERDRALAAILDQALPPEPTDFVGALMNRKRIRLRRALISLCDAAPYSAAQHALRYPGADTDLIISAFTLIFDTALKVDIENVENLDT